MDQSESPGRTAYSGTTSTLDVSTAAAPASLAALAATSMRYRVGAEPLMIAEQPRTITRRSASCSPGIVAHCDSVFGKRPGQAGEGVGVGLAVGEGSGVGEGTVGVGVKAGSVVGREVGARDVGLGGDDGVGKGVVVTRTVAHTCTTSRGGT